MRLRLAEFVAADHLPPDLMQELTSAMSTISTAPTSSAISRILAKWRMPGCETNRTRNARPPSIGARSIEQLQDAARQFGISLYTAVPHEIGRAHV